jgi:predicted dienelactone hydrolase
MRARDGLAAASVVVVFLTAAAPVSAAPGGAIGRTVYRLIDHTRLAHFRNGTTRPRTLITYVRYPRSRTGTFPLIVFGHGFASTPGVYASLLDAWTRAGYVVAAPLFPVENAHAPGGPDEADLANQPGDISFVISRLLSSNLRSLIDPSRIVVAGQSDGGETALAVAYDRRFRDPRVKAAVILSGARLPGQTRRFPKHSPPLLATQGSADTINPPVFTHQFFDVAPRPKYLLTLRGAGHLPPYTTNERQLAVVERVTIAFLNHYLRHGPLRALLSAGRASGIAQLTADP